MTDSEFFERHKAELADQSLRASEPCDHCVCGPDGVHDADCFQGQFQEHALNAIFWHHRES